MARLPKSVGKLTLLGSAFSKNLFIHVLLWVQIILDRYRSFWYGPICFRRVKIWLDHGLNWFEKTLKIGASVYKPQFFLLWIIKMFFNLHESQQKNRIFKLIKPLQKLLQGELNMTLLMVQIVYSFSIFTTWYVDHLKNFITVHIIYGFD